ncbi:MAG: chorismate lyase [Betaproteobacteria bacterium]|nr:chorismate lyase [Betaproteobacteria bacterium]
MSGGSVWRRCFAGRAPAPALRSWLTESGSLTARCQAACTHFRVRLLRFGRARALADEGCGRPAVQVREVLLECDGVPVIFAHTTLSTATGGRLSRWIARLGSRSLGSLLFAHPGFVRGGIEYCRLDSRHPLYRRVAAVAPVGPELWARRSRHRLGVQEVLVTEAFLPAIGALAQGGRRQD